MLITSIKTHVIESHDLLSDVLDKYITKLDEKYIIAITSKILGIMQNRIVSKNSIDKFSLICKEADLLLETDDNPYNMYLTIKNNILLPSAGIDESNVDQVYVLYPENIQETTIWIWQYLREKHNLTELGVIITDSHTTIMRKGVTGIALGWCGFAPLYSYVGKPDLYHALLKVTQLNILDSLAVSAVFVMGEGNEKTPIAIIKDAPHITFLDRSPSEEELTSINISMDQDLYAPLLKAAKWKKT